MPHQWIFPCKMDRAYDGDTFYLELDIGFALQHFVAVRLAGVDTPELRGGTDLTKAAAKLARDEAEKFIRGGAEVKFHCTLWGGKYGRPVGDIYVDGNALSDFLIERRLGVSYDGGSRAAIFRFHKANAQYLKEAGALAPYL